MQQKPANQIAKGEFVKRKADAKKVYILAGYDRSEKRWQLDDWDDCSRCIYVKSETPLFFGFDF